MKKFLSIITACLCAALMFTLAACANNGNGANNGDEPPTAGGGQDFDFNGTSTIVVYFSATNHTKTVAGYIADATGGESFELVPVNPYSSADLNYNNQSSRVYREYLNESLRDTELESYTVENWEMYDIIFIGYPIWWGIAAWPVNNFIKNNDFTGKTVIPFATSASSGLGQSGTLLKEMAGTGNWTEGRRFSSGASETTVRAWLAELGAV